jgi:amino acid transporter
MAGPGADRPPPGIGQPAGAAGAGQPHSALSRAGDSSQHELEPDAIGLVQSTIMSVASSAPTASITISLAALLVAAAYGGGITILIVVLPMLAIAYSFSRLNRWDPNCGASYVWVGRSMGPHIGFMIGWVVLAATIYGDIASALPVGPAFLSLAGLDPSSRLGAALAATVLCGAVILIAVLGIRISARFQVGMFIAEYAILLVFTVIGLWKTFVSQPAGFVHPSAGWLSPTGVGAHGSLVGGLLIAVFLVAGWDASLYVNEETERPAVNPGRAVMLSVVSLGVIYAVMTVAFQGVASEHAMNSNAAAGLSFAAQRLVGSGWDKAMSLAILMSSVASTQIGFVTLARICYAMGTDRLLPRQFSRINRRYRTPVFGTVVVGLVLILVIWLSIYTSTVANAFTTILTSTGILFGTFYAFGALANTWFFRSQIRQSVRSFLLVAAIPLAAAAFLVWIIVKSLQGFTSGAIAALVITIVLGVLAMLAAQLLNKSPFFSIPRERYQPAPPASAGN